MLVRILTSRDGHPCSAEVDVPTEIAKGWIAAGDAEAVAPPKRARKGETETATAADVETRA